VLQAVCLLISVLGPCAVLRCVPSVTSVHFQTVEHIRAAILLHKDQRNRASSDLMQVAFLLPLCYCLPV
jgi:hypothetical protein